jgi:hypothetical protein
MIKGRYGVTYFGLSAKKEVHGKIGPNIRGLRTRGAGIPTISYS